MMSQYNSNKGFTLIEIMIAVTIMATLSLLTANTLQSTIVLKRKVQNKIDRQEKMRSALKIIKKDIELAYHYYNFNLRILDDLRREIASNNKTKSPQQQNSQSGQQQQNQQSPVKQNQQGQKVSVSSIINEYIAKYKQAKGTTNFLGSKEEAHFTSSNHVRRFRDAQESNLMEVGFYLKTCRSLLDANKRSECLWRRSTPFLDDKSDEGGGASVLIENVKSLQFQYYNEKEQEWRDQWYSNENGDDITKGKFPSAVKVSLEVEIDNEIIKEQMVVAIAFPNNPPPKSPLNSNQQNNPNATNNQGVNP